VSLLAANISHKNDVEQRRIVDGAPGDSIAAIFNLQACLSDFQIGFWHPLPSVRFLQGGAHEECQGICKRDTINNK